MPLIFFSSSFSLLSSLRARGLYTLIIIFLLVFVHVRQQTRDLWSSAGCYTLTLPSNGPTDDHSAKKLKQESQTFTEVERLSSVMLRKIYEVPR